MAFVRGERNEPAARRALSCRWGRLSRSIVCALSCGICKRECVCVCVGMGGVKRRWEGEKEIKRGRVCRVYYEMMMMKKKERKVVAE